MILQRKYYGFVYLWFDVVRRKFCIGSHYGSLDDGYVTSTGHMMKAFKKRPETFHRKILSFCFKPDKLALQKMEQEWLNLIKDEELGKKYYNLKKLAAGGNGSANKGNSNCGGWNRGLSIEMIQLRREGLFCLLIDKPKPKKPVVYSQERREVLSENMKQKWKDGKIRPIKPWNKGKTKDNDPSVKKSSETLKGRTAWNKGKTNPRAAENGKKSADKISQTVSGRKRHQRADGSITWKYSDDNGGWWTKENGERVPVS